VLGRSPEQPAGGRPARTAPLRLFECQVFVFHFPGMVEGVIGGVPDQVAKRPGARHGALGMQ